MCYISHSCTLACKKSILCRIYTEYIHHFLSRMQILKGHCKNIDIYILNFSTSVGAGKKALSCISCIQMKNSIQKNKCRGSSMQSTSICSSWACVKLGQFTWEGTVGRFYKKKSVIRHPISMRCSRVYTVNV